MTFAKEVLSSDLGNIPLEPIIAFVETEPSFLSSSIPFSNQSFCNKKGEFKQGDLVVL